MKIKGRVFLLDDDQFIVTVLSRVLKKEGYEIYGETETDSVITKISSWNPDIVILDISMPGRDGIEILQEIKNKEIDTQVVMLTSDDSEHTVAKAMELGAVNYFTKPFDTEELKMALGNIVQKAQLKQEVPTPTPL